MGEAPAPRLKVNVLGKMQNLHGFLGLEVMQCHICHVLFVDGVTEVCQVQGEGTEGKFASSWRSVKALMGIVKNSIISKK